PKQVPLGNYIRPNLDILDYPEGSAAPIPKEELLANARLLEQRLEEFGVQGSVVEINPGPVITRYEYEPAPGIKISKITSLADDLALSMRAKRIRIVAPIPGKAAVGLELPNKEQQLVYLRAILDSEKYAEAESPLTIALGTTISGKPFVTQLSKMPHLLVAGSTGSGKSICLNAIIASILFKAHPTEVKFVLIDPKRLELGIYKRLCYQHLIYREDLDEEVVTTAQNALAVLRSLEFEMEQRYDLFATAGVRHIEDYNQRVKDGRIKSEDDKPVVVPLPSIVVVVDELADLMLTAAKEVEEPIARLTQMARAIGIHLIVATQRPSVDVITGVIKANFPARIAFAVASKTDSRTILDMNGAEKLLGRGDMLFLPPGSPEVIRVHGAFITTEEVEKMLDHIYLQPKYPRKLLPIRDDELGMASEAFGGSGLRDELFRDALKLVVRHQQGSISLLQRRLKVGYARAARLIDELEAAGIVGGFDGSKAREVLMDEEQLEHLDWEAI
ncbi:MAG: DNA translocase FtsK, partial [bacterium]